MGSKEEPKEDLPQYWDLLSCADRNGYNNLKMTFNASSIRRNRGHGIETFDGILEAIRRYAEQRNDNDWKRFLVCGVCWMDQAIAINTRQLRKLISKCKSSINGSLQKLGYLTNTSHSESWKILFARIPLLKDNFTEIRQWTIRYKVSPGIAIQNENTQNKINHKILIMQQPPNINTVVHPLQTDMNFIQFPVNVPNDPIKKENLSDMNREQFSLQNNNMTQIAPLRPPYTSEQQEETKEKITNVQQIQICPLKFRAKFMQSGQVSVRS